MKNTGINFKLLISKKENAEAYKSGIEELKGEIKDIKGKLQLSNIKEEKDILQKEMLQKEDEVANLQLAYDDKKASIEEEINVAKEKILQTIKDAEAKLISKEESNRLKEEKAKKEEELSECENDIKEVKAKLKELIDQDGGYEQDTVSLSKKLDNLTAYKTYIKEELSEIDGKLEDTFIIEDNLEAVKYIKNMKNRLSNLSYSSIEQWLADEKEFQNQILKDEEEVEPEIEEAKNEEIEEEKIEEKPKVEKEEVESIKTDPVKVEPVRGVQTKADPVKATSVKTAQTKTESVKETPVKTEPIKKSEPQKAEQKQNNITSIKIEPWKHNIKIVLSNGSEIVGPTVTEYLNENHKVEDILKGTKVELGKDFNLDKYSKKLDPNILMILEDTNNKETLYRYIKAICNNKKEKLPFDLQYDLEGVSYLEKEERKNINKIARQAKKSGATVEKERFINRLKAMYISGKQLLLNEKNETIEENTEKKSDKKITISKAKTMAVNLGRETVGAFKIVGTRLKGYLNGENKLVTDDKVRTIRNKNFVQKVQVDEKTAVEKVEEAKEGPKFEKPADFIID